MCFLVCDLSLVIGKYITIHCFRQVAMMSSRDNLVSGRKQI